MEWIKTSPIEDARFKENKTLIIYCDGGARGNPGPAGAGAVIMNDDGFVLGKLSEYLGVATNNQAEYQAVLLALQEAVALGAKTIHLYLDSELVVRQLTGEYRVKNENIKNLFLETRKQIQKLSDFKVVHIPREKNEEADKLVNQAINLGV